MEQKLDEKFIIKNVEKIFNSNGKIKNYKVTLDDLDAYVEKIDTNVKAYIVTSNNNDCIFFYCYKINDKYYLQTQGIHKCNNELSSGKFNIMCLLQFCKNNQYDYMIISQDKSQLYFQFTNKPFISISLMKIKLLTNGISWYNSLGFYAENNIDDIKKMKQYINMPISIIVNHIPNISRITNDILKIVDCNMDDSISKIFKKINNLIKINCPNNICNDSFYNNLFLINDYIDLIYKISNIKYNTKNLIMKINTKEEDDMEDYLGGKYISIGKKYTAKKNKTKKLKKIIKNKKGLHIKYNTKCNNKYNTKYNYKNKRVK
jgi:hypothetical protein